jgi:transcriptional regulator with XRE-family HTH domain
MKTPKTTQNTDLPDILKEYLATAPKFDAKKRKALQAAADELDRDPAFLAEFQKSLFVEKILEAMEAQGISQSDLARRWGKSRQYLSRVLDEDRRVNFTLETIFELASLVGRKIEMHVLDPNEHTHVLRCKVTPRMVSATHEFEAPADMSAIGIDRDAFVSREHPAGAFNQEDYDEPIRLRA